MFTELMGSSLNHVVKVNPFSYGHRASGGSTIAWNKHKLKQIALYSIEINSSKLGGYTGKVYRNRDSIKL